MISSSNFNIAVKTFLTVSLSTLPVITSIHYTDCFIWVIPNCSSFFTPISKFTFKNSYFPNKHVWRTASNDIRIVYQDKTGQKLQGTDQVTGYHIFTKSLA